MEEIKGVEIIHLLPKDKVLVIFDTDIHTVETASEVYKSIREFFGERITLGVYGADIKFIRDGENNAENNDKKYFKTLRKNM